MAVCLLVEMPNQCHSVQEAPTRIGQRSVGAAVTGCYGWDMTPAIPMPVFQSASDRQSLPPAGFVLRAAGLPHDVFHLVLADARAEGRWLCDVEPYAPAPLILDQDGQLVEIVEPCDLASISDVPAFAGIEGK